MKVAQPIFVLCFCLPESFKMESPVPRYLLKYASVEASACMSFAVLLCEEFTL